MQQSIFHSQVVYSIKQQNTLDLDISATSSFEIKEYLYRILWLFIDYI